MKVLKDKMLFERFQEEVDFYQIKSLQEMIILKSTLCVESCAERLQQDRQSDSILRVTHSIGDADCGVLLLKACKRWRIKFFTKCDQLQLGVCDPDIREMGTPNFATSGFLIDAQSGGRLSSREHDQSMDWCCGRFGTYGDVIEFALHLGNLSVTLKGKSYSSAFRDLNTSSLPVVVSDYSIIRHT